MNHNSNQTQYRTPNVPQNYSAASAEWIAGRVKVLLSHYFRPDEDKSVIDAATVDWLEALEGFSAEAIDAACQAHIRTGKFRPTPAMIRERCEQRANKSGRGDKMALSRDELTLLEDKILPTARRWLTIPGLAEHGRQTLAYWGEE